jgi:adenosylcobinamide-phosphate synthase
MVGYRNPRYDRFGWAAARLDDVLGWPAARACAAATVAAAALTGEDPRGALRAWRRDGARHPSPNAGRVEAAFAGALGVTLGGTNDYGGRIEHRPRLGGGPPPDTAALRRAVRLSATASALLAATAAGVAAWR